MQGKAILNTYNINGSELRSIFKESLITSRKEMKYLTCFKQSLEIISNDRNIKLIGKSIKIG